MRLTTSVLVLLTAGLSASLRAAPGEAAGDLNGARERWRHGHVPEAQRLVDEILRTRPGLHEARALRVMTAFALGDYEHAIADHRALRRASRQWRSLAALVVDAELHLGRLDEAVALATDAGLPKPVVAQLEERQRRPLRVQLAQTTLVPLADANANPIADLMPAVAVTINGQRRVAHLDTGGTFLVMSPKAAAELGVATRPIGKARASARATEVSVGIVDELRVGEALLTNVPVHVVSALADADQPKPVQIILGTQVLMQFLTTWDNGAQRLVLSPRQDADGRQRHLAAYASGAEALDLYLMGDHFLLVKGSVGERKDLVFFFDTGLVALDADGRQAALAVTPAVASEWGLKGQPFTPSPGIIRLGAQQQAGHSVMTLDFAKGVPWYDIEVAALLSHGFLKSCVFTLDFDRHKLLLGPAKRPALTEARRAEWATLAGCYEIVPGTAFEVTTAEDGRLYLRAPGQQRVALNAEPDGSFSIPAAAAKILFTQAADGSVESLTLEQRGRTTLARRVACQ